MLERHGHGGDLWTAAEMFGKSKDEFLDFSSNMNPLGPPAVVQTILRERWRDVVAYPDPAVRELNRKLADKYHVPMESILIGNGAAELIDLAVRVLRPEVTALARPSFSEYEDAVNKTGGRIHQIRLHEANGFTLQLEDAQKAIAASDLLFLGSPNNPTGRMLPQDVGVLLAQAGKPVILDEAFIDFCPDEPNRTMIRQAASSRHLMVIRSMTKFYSIPGLRLGFIVAHPDRIAELRCQQVHWSVNTMAQLVGAAVLEDSDYEQRTHSWLAEERPWLTAGLQSLGLIVTPSDTNYVLFSLRGLGLRVRELQAEMGRRGVLIRDASLFPGLDETYVRVAVRLREHNVRLLRELQASIQALLEHGEGKQRNTVTPHAFAADQSAKDGPLLRDELSSFSPGAEDERLSDASLGKERMMAPPHLETEPSLAPTLMVQGTSSDAGKSLITTALCRILLQDGLRVAPFKSQNMSLNSYVTPDGKEIGRAQGMQADACRIPATTDMNPILLKPKKDMISQVVVHGKPYRDLDARTYREKYLGEAETIVKDSLRRLRQAHDVVVLEGAGSPAEVNLKSRDIVNMRLAGWADAPVVLVADIDRGGVFASIVGTMDILSEEERDRVRGFIINKFRGDVTLLQPGLEWLENRTGKPVLGVVPYLPDLELEDEDSASLDRKLATGVLTKGRAGSGAGGTETESKSEPILDIAVIRLPRLSNFTDIDPLLYEADVSLRFVQTPEDLGQPDAVILPGSKNTVDDLLFLRQTGLEQALQSHVEHGGRMVGICAGYQMMGERLLDPELVESDRPEIAGIGLFPTETVFTAEKRTVQAGGWTQLYGNQSGHSGEADRYPVNGYEIHMGRTSFLQPVEHPFQLLDTEDGSSAHPDGAVTNDGKCWGTYVHGILHNDDFRRAWLNAIRTSKGLEPAPAELRFQARREAAFDRLADHVRSHLDMELLYEMMGIRKLKEENA